MSLNRLTTIGTGCFARSLAVCFAFAGAIPFASANEEDPSRNNLLSRLEAIAPPIIRSCIVDSAKQIPLGEIAAKAASSDNPHPDEEAQAKFAVEYLREKCFSVLEDPSYPENTDDPWRSPKAFALALQNHVFMQAYDSRALQNLIDAYNEHQNCLFGLAYPCIFKEISGRNALVKHRLNGVEQSEFTDAAYPPRGHSQLKLIEATGLFGLVVTLTDHSHTPMVDGGIDRFKTMFFRQADMSFASEFEALHLDLPKRAFSILSDGVSTSCAGTQYGNNLIVLESATSSEIARIRLPNGVEHIDLHDSSNLETVQLQVRGQQLLNDRRAEKCELPYWAKYFDYRYTVRCDVEKKKCRVQKRLVRLYQGCADIGGCD